MVYNCSTYFLEVPRKSTAFDGPQYQPARALVDELTSQCQDAFERPLSIFQQNDINQACYLLSLQTSGAKLPRLFQILSALEVLSGKNLVVRAGTGSGKSIAMALPMLLRPNWIFVTIAPLMALQHQHVSPPTISIIYNSSNALVDRSKPSQDLASNLLQSIKRHRRPTGQGSCLYVI